MNSPVVCALQTFQGNQLAGSNRPYEIDASALAVNAWQGNAAVSATDLIRPTGPNQTGFVYQADADGQTGETEPAWPKTAGGTVIDGSVTWTAVAPPANGEDAIASAAWTQQSPPDGTLTITGNTNTTRIAKAFIGGGTSGSTYSVIASITMTSGAIYPVQIIVTIL